MLLGCTIPEQDAVIPYAVIEKLMMILGLIWYNATYTV